jgi:hypothetical protein
MIVYNISCGRFDVLGILGVSDHLESVDNNQTPINYCHGDLELIKASKYAALLSASRCRI